MVRLSLEPFSERIILRRDACRAGILRADTHHHAAHADERSCREPELLRAQKRCDRHVPSAHELAVRLQNDLAAETVLDQRLMGFTDAELPGKPRMVDR